MRLTAGYRAGVHNKDVEIVNADEKIALSWLRKLDGKQHTLLSLQRADASSLMIGGGPFYYVVTLDDGRQNLTLKNPCGSETEMVELCAGGQYGEYPKAFCVDQEQAAQTVLRFFQVTESQAE